MASPYAKVAQFIPVDHDGESTPDLALRCWVGIAKGHTIPDGVRFFWDGHPDNGFIIPFEKLESAYLENKWYREKAKEKK